MSRFVYKVEVVEGTPFEPNATKAKLWREPEGLYATAEAALAAIETHLKKHFPKHTH